MSFALISTKSLPKSSAFRSSLMANTSNKALFSSACQPAEKLRCIMEEYRQEHYTYETRTRFRKDVVKACRRKAPTNNIDGIPVDQLNTLLVDIGRPNDQLSEKELMTLLQEAGRTSDRLLPVEKVMQLM